jgi:hypothetical protein
MRDYIPLVREAFVTARNFARQSLASVLSAYCHLHADSA